MPAPLADHPGGIKNTGFASDRLEAILGSSLPFVIAKEPLMTGDLLAFIKDLHQINGKL
jgi:hypothetical protein